MNKLIRRFLAVKGPIRLGQALRTTVYVIGAGVWATGGLWLAFHYFARRQTEFGPEPHPFEHWWLVAHAAFAFAALWLVGRLSVSHIVNGWVSGRRRWSGVIILSIAGLMILTGFLLYYVGSDVFRAYISYVHWIVGLSAPLFFVWHRFLAREKGLFQ